MWQRESNFASNNATLDIRIRSLPVTSLICSVRPVTSLFGSQTRTHDISREALNAAALSLSLNCFHVRVRSLLLSVYSCVLEAHSRNRFATRRVLLVDLFSCLCFVSDETPVLYTKYIRIAAHTR